MRSSARVVWNRVRVPVAGLVALLALGACHAPVRDLLPGTHPAVRGAAAASPEAPPGVTGLGEGAAPGDASGPGGFVPRGSAKSFYAGARGRLWYYMNNYYWVSPTAPREGLWIKTEVAEAFRDLRTWPGGKPVESPQPKVTVEYWKVGPTGRSIRLDNHKDYLLLSDRYSAGAITVQLTLTLGHLEVEGEDGQWAPPQEAYVLESRNYRGGGGLGSGRARFRALPTEAVTVWGYRVPWDTHPQRLTRSNWRRLALPAWRLLERRRPRAPGEAPVVTPREEPQAGS